MSLDLKFIGRGSAFNILEGNTSAYLKKNSSLLLIDCGSNIFERLLKFNILDGISEVTILITHNHPDHIGSLGDLLYYLRFELRLSVSNINVIAGDGLDTNEILRRQGVRCLNLDDSSSCKFKEDNSLKIYCYKEVSDEFNIEMSDLFLSLKFIETDHYDCLLSYGIELIENLSDSCNSRIFYSGDIRLLDSEIINKLESGYYERIYVDVTMQTDFEGNPHLTYDKLKKLIVDCYRCNVYCMHLNKGFDESLAFEEGFNVVKLEY